MALHARVVPASETRPGSRPDWFRYPYPQLSAEEVIAADPAVILLADEAAGVTPERLPHAAAGPSSARSRTVESCLSTRTSDRAPGLASSTRWSLSRPPSIHALTRWSADGDLEPSRRLPTGKRATTND